MSNAEILPILQSIEKRLAAIESKMGVTVSSNDSSTGTGAGEDLPRQIKAFDDYCLRCLDPFVSACTKLGGDVEKGGKLVAALWNEKRTFFLMASKCKEPANIASTLTVMSSKLKELGNLVQKNDFENHMKTLSEVTTIICICIFIGYFLDI
jgi:adenylyl cyclase-associated protein